MKVLKGTQYPDQTGMNYFLKYSIQGLDWYVQKSIPVLLCPQISAPAISPGQKR
jgi:hypothetical protein